MKAWRLIAGVVLVVSLGLLVTTVVFHHRASQWKAVAEALRSNADERKVIVVEDFQSAELERLKQQIADLQNELRFAKAGADSAEAHEGGALVVPAKGEQKESGTGKSMMKSMAEVMTDPAMKDVMRQQQRIALKGMYGDLFSELGLTPEDEDTMMELLLDKQMVNMDLGMQMMTGSLSQEERKAVGEQIVESIASIDAEIEEFLGPETFASYELFVDSQQERMQLNAFKNSLRNSEEPLSFEAEEQLMNAMYETRKNFDFSTDFGTEANPNPEAWLGFNEEAADQMISEMRRLNEQIAGKAASILSPGQLEAFRGAQENQVRMQEMGIRMGLQMQE